MADKRIPLQVKDLTGDIQTLSGYVVALRSGNFETNNILGVEASEQHGYYDFTGIEINVRYQLWAGVTTETMSMNTAFSDENGTVIFGVDESYMLDPADYEDYDIPVKVTVSTVEQFVPKTINEIVDGSNASMNDYYFLRGKLYQDNSLYSGRPFFGSVSVNESTGALVGSSTTYLQNAAGSIVNTISNYVYRTGSAKVSTGIYSIQCQTGATTGTAVNGMIVALNGAINRYKFENSVWSVFGSRAIDLVLGTVYNVSHIQRFSGSAVRVKFTGISDYTIFDDYVGYSFEFADVTGDISPTVNGTRVLTAVGADYVEFAHTSASGTGTFAVVTGTVTEISGYTETYVPGLVGYVALDVNHEAQTYYDTGKLIIKTYDTDWVLADDILSYGITLTFKALKISY